VKNIQREGEKGEGSNEKDLKNPQREGGSDAGRTEREVKGMD
jgi:hypothetical protein